MAEAYPNGRGPERAGVVNISPRMIEDVLFTHPAAAAIGVPDESWGETVLSSVTNGRGGIFRAAAWR
jgi:hypothetical protein